MSRFLPLGSSNENFFFEMDIEITLVTVPPRTLVSSLNGKYFTLQPIKRVVKMRGTSFVVNYSKDHFVTATRKTSHRNHQM